MAFIKVAAIERVAAIALVDCEYLFNSSCAGEAIHEQTKTTKATAIEVKELCLQFSAIVVAA